ncbi:uncharacterized protein [Physcomitrium patens]|uniref:uncharacterized protein n=1 Tax=Physcomitrium patens TaxID=3218 RepID=UPI000D15BC2C|nr:uncharacterized protein LOC112290429 [Physcomitrium patens]|eukprot:XP_024392408.1 uncharacterized protein LOC112290429 [Physcomitrella patens]
MGQTWSKFMSGHMDAGSNPPAPETCTAQEPSTEQSQASTEASSSVPIFQGGWFRVAVADVELSSLKGDEKESDEEHIQERRNERQTTPTHSTSQQLSPLPAFKVPEKIHLKKSQSSASTAFKISNKKSRASKQPRISSSSAVTRFQQHYAPKTDAEPARKLRTHQESLTPSPSQFSQLPDEEALHLAQMEDEDEEEGTPSQAMLPEVENDVKIEPLKEEAQELMQPLQSSAQKLLFFELDRKRKAPAGLPSLAIEYTGSSHMKLKPRTLLEKPSEGGSRKIPGGGEAPVGRRVRKTIGNRGVAEGHVSSRVYETECDKQKEEAIEWLDPESYLVHQNKTTSAPIEEGKVIKPLRKSLRNAQKVKKVEEFVYTRRTVRRRRRKK